ncbi:MAG: HD domain-containing protein [Chthoniobacteraceae bacterium]
MAILSRKGQVGRILRLMHETDFLGRYIPEFGELTCLVQHEFFHRYTADEHTLVCIEKLDELIDTEQHRLADYKALFQRLEDPAVLYLALLLHDTGKSANVRYHSEASALMAQRVSARLQLSSARRRTLISLVDNHILLSSTAQRRNLEDSATISEFAGVINNQTNLDALMLLTLVDGQGLGEETWSDWKESLVWQLYRNSSRFLEDGISFFREREIAIKELLAEVTKKMARDFSDEIEAHFHSMPARYFQTTAQQDIVNHIRLFRAFMEMREDSEDLALAPAIRWVQRPERGHTELLVVSWDRKHLLAEIAGAISLANLNILSADIYTRSDDLVLDIFRVCDTKHQAVTDEKDFTTVEKNLRQSLIEEDYDFAPLLEKQLRKRNSRLIQEHDFPTRINIDNRAHPVYTLVDIQTPDRLGLLYNLMRAVGTLEMDIALSRITTEKGAAIDTFYITERGHKIRSEEGINSIKQALLTATGQVPDLATV